MEGARCLRPCPGTVLTEKGLRELGALTCTGASLTALPLGPADAIPADAPRPAAHPPQRRRWHAHWVTEGPVLVVLAHGAAFPAARAGPGHQHTPFPQHRTSLTVCRIPAAAAPEASTMCPAGEPGAAGRTPCTSSNVSAYNWKRGQLVTYARPGRGQGPLPDTQTRSYPPGDGEITVMADSKASKPYPPRWVMIYLLVLGLCAIVWIILCVMHGGTPWTHHW